jgi:hypothetical protein
MELPRTLEAADIPELGGQNHGSVGLEATEAADQVPHLFVGLGRDVDEGEATIPEVPGELDGVPAIGLSMFARPARDQGGSRQLTLDPPLGQRALEYVARPGGLVGMPPCSVPRSMRV